MKLPKFKAFTPKKMKTPKFKAYLPEFDLMLNDITVEPYGDIGIDSKTFEKELQLKHRDFFIDWENSCIGKNNEEKNIFENRISSQPCYKWDWLELNRVKCILLECSEFLDRDGKKIFQGDIIHNKTWKPEFYKVVFSKKGGVYFSPLTNVECPKKYPMRLSKDFTIVGNIHQYENVLPTV